MRVRERTYFYKREACIRGNLLLPGKCAHSQYIVERRERERDDWWECVYLSVVVIIVSDDLVGLMIREMYGGNSLKTQESWWIAKTENSHSTVGKARDKLSLVETGEF